MPKSSAISKTLILSSSIKTLDIHIERTDFAPQVAMKGKDVVLHIYLPDDLRELFDITSSDAVHTVSLEERVHDIDDLSDQEELDLIRGFEKIVDSLKKRYIKNKHPDSPNP